jgi:hypothetical protein
MTPIVMGVMSFSTKQINELRDRLDDLGLMYTEQDLQEIAYSIAKFVLVSEVRHSEITILEKEIHDE